MKKNISIFTFLMFTLIGTAFGNKTYADLSMRLIEAVRNNQPHQAMLDSLASVDQSVLAKELDNDNARKAFWINVYNAHIQIFLKEDPEQYDNRNSFFHAEKVVIAGEKLSFDKIEHGIIRRSKAKLSLGFLPKLFVGKFERKFRTKKTDGRIHFALNCGALSCPAVAAYDYRKMNKQLDLSTKIYLQKTTEYNKEENEVNISRLFSWFRGDFGNKKKVIKFLKKYDTIPSDVQPSIKYKKYDWTMDLDNYIDLKRA